jgi:hypothetical protein
MKKILKNFIVSLSLVSFINISCSALIYHQTDNYYNYTPLLSCGVDDIYFYISTGYQTTPYATNFAIAASSWNKSGDIQLTQTTTYMDSVCDIYAVDTTTPSYSDYDYLTGYIKIWIGGNFYRDSSLIPSDYPAGEVFINIQKVSASNASYTKRIVSHEIGHILGLGHPYYTSTSIMNANESYSSTSVPISADKSHVADIYNYNGY